LKEAKKVKPKRQQRSKTCENKTMKRNKVKNESNAENMGYSFFFSKPEDKCGNVPSQNQKQTANE